MPESNLESNKAIARRYYNEIMNGGNHNTIDELMTSDLLFSNPPYPQPEPGLEGFKQLLTNFHNAFRGTYFNIDNLLAEDDTVVVQWTAQGKHTGVIKSATGEIAPSGRTFKLSGITWLYIKDGKIRKVHINEDALGMLMQLGIIPTGEEVIATESPSTEAKKAIVHRYFSEIMSQGNLAIINELMTEDFIIRISSLHEPFRGHEGMKQFVSGLRTAFPDITFKVENLIAEGDKIACHFTSISTHQAEFAGIPATGKEVKDQGSDIFSFANGKIAEILVNENALGLMQQLGAIPPLG